jgi:hypothetical protein
VHGKGKLLGSGNRDVGNDEVICNGKLVCISVKLFREGCAIDCALGMGEMADYKPNKNTGNL